MSFITRVIDWLVYGGGCRHDWRDEEGRAAMTDVPRMARWTCAKCGDQIHDWVW